MDPLLVVALVLLGIGVLNMLNSSTEEEDKPEENKEETDFNKLIKQRNCPPHKWTYTNTEEGTGMHCALCKMVPGFIGRE